VEVDRLVASLTVRRVDEWKRRGGLGPDASAVGETNSMSDHDCTGHNGHGTHGCVASEPNWEKIGREYLERSARRTADDVEEAIRLLGVEIGRGTADARDLLEAREAIEAAIHVVEDDLAPAVPEDDRHDRTATGGTVKVGAQEIRALCNGSSVRIETAAGIEVELLPAQLGETNTGP
jgi:hypothetical protein